jgi:hypothetical protein
VLARAQSVVLEHVDVKNELKLPCPQRDAGHGLGGEVAGWALAVAPRRKPMSCDCSRLAYGAKLMLPLECKTILGPFNRALVLTDVVFDLWTHPNGAASKACGFVWNVLPNQWSRLLVGGTVTDEGRQYSLESGILCPQDSHLSICSCFFVSEPTALFQARVTGCFCENGRRYPIDIVAPFPEVAWDDGLPAGELDPIDPAQSRSAADRAASFVAREVLATASDLVGPGDLHLRGAEGAVTVPSRGAVALAVSRNSWRWSSEGARERVARGPRGTNLIVARRSPDGRLVHWAMYRESAVSTSSRARSRKR